MRGQERARPASPSWTLPVPSAAAPSGHIRRRQYLPPSPLPVGQGLGQTALLGQVTGRSHWEAGLSDFFSEVLVIKNVQKHSNGLSGSCVPLVQVSGPQGHLWAESLSKVYECPMAAVTVKHKCRDLKKMSHLQSWGRGSHIVLLAPRRHGAGPPSPKATGRAVSGLSQLPEAPRPWLAASSPSSVTATSVALSMPLTASLPFERTLCGR